MEILGGFTPFYARRMEIYASKNEDLGSHKWYINRDGENKTADIMGILIG